MIKKYLIIVVFSCIFFTLTQSVYAEYVLPYPSFMPGNKIYKISRIADKLKEYWSFGNLAKAKYHLGLSDKNLVEAKTLFEYKQYLLASEALKRSDEHFLKISTFLDAAAGEGKDVTSWRETVQQAATVHANVLASLMKLVPISFEWTPEKEQSTALSLHKALQQSIDARHIPEP